MRRFIIAALVAAQTLLLVVSASALSSLRFGVKEASAPRPSLAVVAGDLTVMRLPANAAGARILAEQVAAGLQQAADIGATPEQVTTAIGKREAEIRVAGRTIVRITKPLAAAAQSTPDGLAKIWAGQVRKALALPQVRVAPDSAMIAVGDRGALAVAGNMADKIAAVSGNAALLEAAFDPAAKQVILTARAVGRTEVTIGAGTATVVVPVRIAKYAGSVAANLTAAVTGTATPESVLRLAAEIAVLRGVTLEPGAALSTGLPQAASALLRLGQETFVTVPVKIEGLDYLPVWTTATVRVKNEQVPDDDATVLMISNSPEKLRARGMWYQGDLPDGQPARLLYHHANMCGQTSDLIIELANRSDQEVRVQVVEGSGRPSEDMIYTGHQAARDYLSNRFANVGYIVPLPPRTTYRALCDRTPEGAIASGIVDFHALSPGTVSVRVRLAPVDVTPLLRPATEAGLTVARGRFPEPRKEIAETYTVGGEWTRVFVGRDPIAGTNEGERLPGNYGVLYRIKFTLVNPTAQYQRVDLVFASGTESARGVLLVDGQRIESGLLVAHAEQRVATFRLLPRQTRDVLIEAMPQAASSYPVTLTVRPAW